MSTEQQALQAAIESLDAQRTQLGDVAVDLALAPLRSALAALAGADAQQALKLVSVLFLDLVGSTRLAQQLDAEDTHAMLDGALARFTRVVQAFHGKVLQYAGDNVLAVFGADAAREDDAERAVRCALALRAEAGATTPGFGRGPEPETADLVTALKVRIGVHTGTVLLGGGVDAAHSIRGAAVHLAARMEQTAPPGAIRISHATYRMVRGLFDVEAQEPLTVKGLDEPVRSYLVLAAAPRAVRGLPDAARGIEGVRTRCIGRDAELGALQDALRCVNVERRMVLASVVGHAGVGKSRLLYEFRLWLAAQHDSLLVLQARAHPQTLGQPYGMLRDVLAGHLNIADGDSMADAKHKFEAGLAPLFDSAGSAALAPAHAHLLGHLVGLDFSASPHVAGIIDDPQQIRSRGLHAAALVLRALARRSAMPIVLLLDDLHFADDGTLDFIDTLIRDNRDVAMLVLGLARPTLFERRAGFGGDAGGASFAYHRIDLEPLGAAARAELTSALLVHMPHVPDALRERIGGVCDGYPFYMEEMVKMLIDEGVIETDADAWRVNLDRLHASRLPHTLTGVLQARLDSLARAEKLALQQASVVGFVFWDEAIAAIEPRSREALPALAQRELIVRNAQAGWDGVAEYAFKHQILHQVAYETVLKRERRAYHAQAAGWLAGLSGARAGDFLGLTGEHFEHAGMTQRACEFFAQAAERAATRHSHAAALGWAARALALLDRAGEAVPADRAAADEPSKPLLLRWRLLDQTERLLDSLGRRVEQRKTIDALNDVANALDDSGKRGEVAWRRSTLAMRTGEFPFMAATAREAIAHAKSADDHSLGLRAQQRLATALGFLGELETARTLAHEGLAGARGLGLRRVEALFLNTLSLIANWLDDPVQTLELCQQTLEASRALGDRTLEATTLCNLGLAWLGLGERAQAQVALDTGMALTRAVGHSATEASLLINRSLLTLWQGDAALASAQAQAALAITLETKSTSVEGEAWRALGYAELALGRHAAAATAFERVRALAPVSKPGLVFDAAAGLAQVALASGDLAAAQRAVEPVLAHLASSGTLDMALAQRSIEWACHQVLVAAGDVRAFEILGSAHAELQAKAATITPPALRESFLHAIPEHHNIVAAWTAHQAA